MSYDPYDYNPADEAEVARRNWREEVGVRVVIGSLVLIVGSLLGAGMAAAVNWLLGAG